MRFSNLKFAFIPISLVLPIYGVVIVTLTGTALIFPDGYPDPFAPYDAIMPGQSIKALENYPRCHLSPVIFIYGIPGTQSACRIPLVDAPFYMIDVTADKDTIQSLWFGAEHLQVVDLVREWGTPDSVYKSQWQYTLCWRKQRVFAVTAAAKRFTYQALIRTILVDHALRCSTDGNFH
jgi:hypothetical protein